MATRKRALDHLLLTLLLLLAAAAVTACGSSPTALLEAEDGTVIAAISAGDAGLRIENRDSVARYFLAVERETAAMIDLYFHPDAREDWFQVEAGATGVLPREDILGWEPGATAAIVYSWTDVVAHPLPDDPERVQWGPQGFLWVEVEL